MEFAKPAHQLDFARSRIDDSICHQHRRCADEAASIWYGKDHRTPFVALPNANEAVWVPAQPIESNKVVKEMNGGETVFADDMDRLLCSEYMQNGSFGMYQSDKQHGIDWRRQRCEILKRISMGLSYLHEEQKHHIHHADLKPDNILRDENYTVEKLADFGISRCLVKEERTPTTKSGVEIPGHTDLNQVVLSCQETGKSSLQRAPFDVLMLGSGAVIGAMVHVANINTVPASYTALKMYSAVLVLSLVCALAAAISMLQDFFRSNQTEEQSDKPRSNRAPATNSSDKTTHTPMANKLSDNNEAENHSDPSSCVAEREHRTTEANKRRPGEWYIATGAAHHATGNRDLITDLVELESDALRVHAADGTPMPVRGRGNVVTEDVVLPDVYYVPGLCANLVSVGQLAGMDYCVGFGRGACVVSDAAGTVIGRAHARGDGLYVTDFLRVPLGGTP